VDRAKLRRDLDHYGPLLVGWRWLGDAAERFLGLRLFAIVRSELATVTGPDLAEGTTATKLAPEQVRALAGVPDLDLAPAFVEDAIARGDTCWASWRDGKVVGYTWRATNGLTPHDDAVAVAYPPDTGYGYKSFVAPSERGGSTVWALTFLADAELRDEGYDWDVWFTSLFNLAMRRYKRYPWSKHSKDGGHESDAGVAGYVRWGARAWCFRTPGVAATGFAFVPVGRVEVRHPGTAPAGT
jgi:hypothetical protein